MKTGPYFERVYLSCAKFRVSRKPLHVYVFSVVVLGFTASEGWKRILGVSGTSPCFLFGFLLPKHQGEASKADKLKGPKADFGGMLLILPLLGKHLMWIGAAKKHMN